jgi:hypothetical protein
MTKKEVAFVFDGIEGLAQACQVSRQTIHNWSETLTEKQKLLVMGAALSNNKEIPSDFLLDK